jgi:hypothetical protein
MIGEFIDHCGERGGEHTLVVGRLVHTRPPVIVKGPRSGD